MSRQPKFQVGDIVRHKATGRNALVLDVEYDTIELPGGYRVAEWEFTGFYVLSPDFGERARAHEETLELVRRPDPEEDTENTT